MESPKTKERELKGLVACSKALKTKNGLILTKSEEGTETHSGIKIKFVPLWKWLLSG